MTRTQARQKEGTMILTVTLNAAIDKRYVVNAFEEGEVNRVISCEYTPGGKGLNVSKPAAISGAEVVATGIVAGFAGKYIEENIQHFGVQSAFYHVEGESRSCINIWDEAKHQQTEFLEPGIVVTKEGFQGFLSHYKELLPKADVVAMSGSVPKGLGTDTYQALVRLAREAGKKVILDTSGELLRKGIEAKPTMVKPNIDEIRMLTGSHCDSQEELIHAAKKIREAGVEVVVVSLGGDGAIMACENGIFRSVVPKIDAVNTVGCGDSMIAGFATGFELGLPLEDTLKRAAAMSAAAALREETGFYVPEDMERILKEVRIEKIDEADFR